MKTSKLLEPHIWLDTCFTELMNSWEVWYKTLSHWVDILERFNLTIWIFLAFCILLSPLSIVGRFALTKELRDLPIERFHRVWDKLLSTNQLQGNLLSLKEIQSRWKGVEASGCSSHEQAAVNSSFSLLQHLLSSGPRARNLHPSWPLKFLDSFHGSAIGGIQRSSHLFQGFSDPHRGSKI